MKVLKIIGIVAGIHAVALLLIFANPGCSSTSKAAAAAAADPSPKADVSATVNLPASPLTSAPGGAPEADASASGAAIRYSPTRPGTPLADALGEQPVADVTPATTYTVARGDTLGGIARKHHLTKAELASANGLKTGSPLRLGQKLILPGGSPGSVPRGLDAADETRTEAVAGAAAAPGLAVAKPDAGAAKGPVEGIRYKVKPGETLGAIARKYHMRVGDIAAANSISDPKRIQPGQELIIPNRSASGAKSAKGVRGKSGAAGAPSTGASPGEARPSPESPAPAAAPAGDLDAGLTPASPADVPVIKVDENPGSSAPKP